MQSYEKVNDESSTSNIQLNLILTQPLILLPYFLLDLGNLMKANTGETESVFFIIRSLRINYDQLCVLVDSLKKKLLLIALCETWLTENDCLEMFQLDVIRTGFLKIGKKGVVV